MFVKGAADEKWSADNTAPCMTRKMIVITELISDIYYTEHA